jgi:hypothetical protein
MYVHCQREETAAGTLLCSTVSARKDDREIVTLPVSLYVPKEAAQ